MSGRFARRTVAVVAVIAAAGLLSSAAQARPGDLDRTFAKQGKIVGGPSVGSLAVQADNKVLVLGSSSIARLNANGKPDKPFGDGKDDGSASVGTTGGEVDFGDLALQPDGKIVVIGTQRNFDAKTEALVVSRLTPDGELDPTFAGTGTVTIPLPGTGFLLENAGKNVAVQADGRIVAAVDWAGVTQIARLLPGGTPDPALGGDGMIEAGLGGVSRDLALTASGGIILVGSSGGGSSDFAIGNLNPDGTANAGFSGDGVQTTDFGADDAASGVALQADGGIVVGGTTSSKCGRATCSSFALARYGAGGELDPSFGTGGKTTASGPGGIEGSAVDVALTGDGKIIVAGGGLDFLVARFGSNGTLDPSFGEGGLTWTAFLGNYPAYANAMALGPDGKIVVGGLVYVEEFYDFSTIARYQVGDGPANVDADKLGDAKDRCARTFGTHSSGCPVIKRTLKLRYSKNGKKLTGHAGVNQVSGESLAGYRQSTARICQSKAGGKVTVFEQRKGPDRKVGKFSDSFFKISNPGRGTYYATVGRAFPTAFGPDGPVELCTASTSEPLKIG